MAKSEKTIFAAKVNGIQRELFSVRQWKNADLLIVSRAGELLEHIDGSPSKVKHQHYSVHQGESDPTITYVTQKTAFHDHPDLSFVSAVHDSQQHLLWPVHARRAPFYAEGVRLLKARPKDTVVEIGEFTSLRANFFYTIFVTRPGFNCAAIAANQVGYRTITFQKFELLVLTTYLNVPSVNEGDIILRTTSSPKVGEELFPGHFQIRVGPIPAVEVLQTHFEMMNSLRAILRTRIYNFLPPDSIPPQDIEMLLKDFTNVPMYK